MGVRYANRTAKEAGQDRDPYAGLRADGHLCNMGGGCDLFDGGETVGGRKNAVGV
jgi:hypothetical protein